MNPSHVSYISATLVNVDTLSPTRTREYFWLLRSTFDITRQGVSMLHFNALNFNPLRYMGPFGAAVGPVLLSANLSRSTHPFPKRLQPTEAVSARAKNRHALQGSPHFAQYLLPQVLPKMRLLPDPSMIP